MELIDTHAHLDMLEDSEAVLKRARAVGVAQVVTIGVDPASSRRAAQLAKTHPGVFYTVGLHPHDTIQANETLWTEMEALARAGAVAVGECGLDYYRDLSPRAAQREVFARQIDLARRLRLPLVIHDRDAHAETAAMLREHHADEVGGVFHCFSGDPGLAKEALDLGFMLGATGTITYPKNEALRALMCEAPRSRLVIETDCPYLAPVPHRGKKNEPAFLSFTNLGLAQALGMEAEACAALTTANARRLYGLPGVEAGGVCGV
jgi:TatD DNase family protein